MGWDYISEGGLMALHPCPRCGMLIPLGLAYCDVCRPIAEQQAREAMARKADQRKRRYNAAYNRRRDPDGPEPDWEYVQRALTSIWDVAHIDVSEILRRAGLNGADVIRRYGIPRRTVSSWRTKNPVEHRECPPWVRLMLAELTGVFRRP